MDFYPVIVQVIDDFWYIPLILVLLASLKIPSLKGWLCLCIVNLFACLLLDKTRYHPVTNIILPSENGTTQVDHIILSVYGVFVVESNKMKGLIYGSPDQMTWIQKKYRHTNNFENPLLQNYRHAKTLQSILGLKDNQIHSVVVFPGNSIFKTVMPENVTRGPGFIRFIKSKKQQVLSDTEVMEIKLKLVEIKLDRYYETNKKIYGKYREYGQ